MPDDAPVTKTVSIILANMIKNSYGIALQTEVH